MCIFQEIESASPDASPDASCKPQRIGPYKLSLSVVKKKKDVPAGVLELSSDSPPKVICNACNKSMVANLSRNMENVKKHLSRPKHLSAVQKMEARRKAAVMKESTDKAHTLFSKIDEKYPNTFELYVKDDVWFIHCQVCLSSINLFPKAGEVHHNIGSHVTGVEHLSAAKKASKGPGKFRQPSLLAFTKKQQD